LPYYRLTVLQAAGYGIVYFAKKMLEDKGISLEGKRCLITGSDSVSTLICFSVHAFLRTSYYLVILFVFFLNCCVVLCCVVLCCVPLYCTVPAVLCHVVILNSHHSSSSLSSYFPTILSHSFLHSPSALTLFYPFHSYHSFTSFLSSLVDFYSSGRETN
jgi:hypothetical protein